MGIGRVEGAWTVCCKASVVKVSKEFERCILSVYGFREGLRYDRSAWYVADVKSVGVGGKLLEAVQCFYGDSRECVMVGMNVSEWFPVNLGLRQGFVMYPWLYNVHMVGEWCER